MMFEPASASSLPAECDQALLAVGMDRFIGMVGALQHPSSKKRALVLVKPQGWFQGARNEG